MGKIERLNDDPDEVGFKPKARGGKENNDYHKRNKKSKPAEKPIQSDGRFRDWFGTGDATPESPHERMLRMLAVQHPESKPQIPHADETQSTLRKALQSKRPKQ